MKLSTLILIILGFYLVKYYLNYRESMTSVTINSPIPILTQKDTELVVGERVCTKLKFTEVGEADHSDSLKAKRSARFGPGMSGYNPALTVNDNGVGDAKTQHRIAELFDLFFRVPAGVAVGGLETFQRHHFNLTSANALVLEWSVGPIVTRSSCRFRSEYLYSLRKIALGLCSDHRVSPRITSPRPGAR